MYIFFYFVGISSTIRKTRVVIRSGLSVRTSRSNTWKAELWCLCSGLYWGVVLCSGPCNCRIHRSSNSGSRSVCFIQAVPIYMCITHYALRPTPTIMGNKTQANPRVCRCGGLGRTLATARQHSLPMVRLAVVTLQKWDKLYRNKDTIRLYYFVNCKI